MFDGSCEHGFESLLSEFKIADLHIAAKSARAWTRTSSLSRATLLEFSKIASTTLKVGSGTVPQSGNSNYGRRTKGSRTRHASQDHAPRFSGRRGRNDWRWRDRHAFSGDLVAYGRAACLSARPDRITRRSGRSI